MDWVGVGVAEREREKKTLYCLTSNQNVVG